MLVLGVTAGLVESVPGRVGEAEAGPAAGGGPYTTEEHGNEVLVELSVARTAVGPADITIEAKNHDGTPASPEEVTGQLRLPERDLGPIDLALEDQGGGTYRSSGAELPFPGRGSSSSRSARRTSTRTASPPPSSFASCTPPGGKDSEDPSGREGDRRRTW